MQMRSEGVRISKALEKVYELLVLSLIGMCTCAPLASAFLSHLLRYPL